MGHTTSISDYELARGDGPPPCEGYDIEAEAPAEKSATKSSKSKKKAPTEEVEEIDVEALTIPELQAELDALGVDYAANDRKADLQDKLYEALG